MLQAESIYSVKSVFPNGDFISKSALTEAILSLPAVKTISTIRYGNRLDLVAYQNYGSVDFWWVIGLYNKIIDPFDFADELSELHLPNLAEVKKIISAKD